MKKRMLIGLAALAALLLLNSCQKIEYEAYVTIVNIGNMPMNAWVEDDKAEIAAYDSLTWSIKLESEEENVQLHLEAEPVGGGDYDEITVILHGDRDIVTWLAGWDLVQGGKPLKKQGRVLHGPAPSSVTSNK
jgi:hypothetical protein